jgi:hypothetical protein
VAGGRDACGILAPRGSALVWRRSPPCTACLGGSWHPWRSRALVGWPASARSSPWPPLPLPGVGSAPRADRRRAGPAAEQAPRHSTGPASPGATCGCPLLHDGYRVRQAVPSGSVRSAHAGQRRCGMARSTARMGGHSRGRDGSVCRYEGVRCASTWGTGTVARRRGSPWGAVDLRWMGTRGWFTRAQHRQSSITWSALPCG